MLILNDCLSLFYPDKKANVKPMEREYCDRLVKNEKGEIEKDSRGVAKVIKATEVAEVDSQYMAEATEATEVIKKQILKAGLRLAAVINEMAAKQYPEDMEAISETKIQDLKAILNEFSNQ